MFISIFRHVLWIFVAFVCVLMLLYKHQMKTYGEFKNVDEAAFFFNKMDAEGLLSSRNFMIGCGVKKYSGENLVFLGSSVVLEMVGENHINLGQCFNSAFDVSQGLPSLVEGFGPSVKVLLVVDPWWFDESQGSGSFNPSVNFNPFGVLLELWDFEFLFSDAPVVSGVRGYHAHKGMWGIDRKGNIVTRQTCEFCLEQTKVWQFALMRKLDTHFARSFGMRVAGVLEGKNIQITLPPVYLDGYKRKEEISEFYVQLSHVFKTVLGEQFIVARECWPPSKESFRDRLHMNRSGSNSFLNCIGF